MDGVQLERRPAKEASNSCPSQKGESDELRWPESDCGTLGGPSGQESLTLVVLRPKRRLYHPGDVLIAWLSTGHFCPPPQGTSGNIIGCLN